jgi:XTP/dITP diphosphohydrolase
MATLVLASNNAKKLVELRTLCEPLGVQLQPQSAFGVAEAEEPHATFVENALAKARHAAAATGLPALADDSGLCVDALGGAPGVISSHFAPLGAEPGDREQQRQRQDAANNHLLLQKLAGISERRARFVSVLVALRSAQDPEPLIAFGRWEGEVLPQLRGEGGFGYDPLLWIPALGHTVAELGADLKNQHSHRAMAARALRVLMREAWRLG